MSLAKQYFDDSLVSIKQQDHIFSVEQEKKSNHITANNWRAIQLLEAVISSPSGQTDSYILAERFC